jgi:hypothetical protein
MAKAKEEQRKIFFDFRKKNHRPRGRDRPRKGSLHCIQVEIDLLFIVIEFVSRLFFFCFFLMATERKRNKEGRFYLEKEEHRPTRRRRRRRQSQEKRVYIVYKQRY